MMQNKFNIALVPTAEYADTFITYAAALPIKAAEYLLGMQSIPHVTLCQFESNDQNLQAIANKVRALKQPAIQLNFPTQRCKTYPANSAWSAWSWVSLIPDNQAELKSLHLQITAIVTPLNSAFDAYDPHLTLLNSKDEAKCDRINLSPSLNPAMSGTFEIVLAKLDNVGQITEILYNCCA